MQHNTDSAEDDQFPNQCNINRAHDPIFALRSSICGALRGNLSEKTVSFRVGISGRPRVLINQATPKQCHPTSSQVSCALRSEIRIHFWSLTSFLYPCCMHAERSMSHAPCAGFFVSLAHYLRRHSNLIHHAPRRGRKEKNRLRRISKERAT